MLPRHTGKCARLHGHSWKLQVDVIGRVDPLSGFVMDYGDLKAAVQPMIDTYLDHYHLNDILENPTSENLLRWIGAYLYNVPWVALVIEETCTSAALLMRPYSERRSLNGEEGKNGEEDGEEDAQGEEGQVT
jgi:6-pyruvoyltetrahydropterin/6-carboxytetrahydropterin synthase